MDYAILAPVPEIHLKDGQLVADAKGHVSFGSNKWEFFADLDVLRRGEPVPVLIYPSHDELGDPKFKVTWKGWYISSLTDTGDKIDEEREGHRPPSTVGSPTDDHRYWAVYWKVRDLRPLPPEHQVRIGDLRSHRSGKWRQNAAPRGPELIERPSFT
jgi:hypothetical protein